MMIPMLNDISIKSMTFNYFYRNLLIKELSLSNHNICVTFDISSLKFLIQHSFKYRTTFSWKDIRKSELVARTQLLFKKLNLKKI